MIQGNSVILSSRQIICSDDSVDVPIETPTRFPEGVDIKVNAISPDGASYGAIAIRGWLESE